ncbi:MAG: MMPL family transporter [Chloroflexota bacterium]
MRTLTTWVLGHKLVVTITWVIVTFAGLAMSQTATNALSQKFSLPGREAYTTDQAIVHTFGNGGDSNPIVPVITLPAGTTVDSPGVRSQLAAAYALAASKLPGFRVVSYATTHNRVLVSRDGRTTMGLIYTPELKGFNDFTNFTNRVKALFRNVTIDGAHFHVTGQDVLAAGSGSGSGPSLLVEVLFGGVGALLVLIFVFRSFMALVPLLMAFVSIPTTFLLVLGLTKITDISFIVQFLVGLIGLGVAIDYSLLVVVRWREERVKGLENSAAVVRAMETAGRAVLFSGTTVAIGLLALIVLPVPFLRSMGYGGMLIPLVTVAAALTLLPVMLATVGPSLDWPRSKNNGAESRFWHSWAALVVRFRWIAAALGIAILAVLVSAAASISLGQSKADALAKSGDAYKGLKALERSGFQVGVLSPFEVLVQNGNPAAVAAQLQHLPGVRGAIAPTAASWHRGTAALVDVLPNADASSGAGRATVTTVRQAVKGQAGRVRVGGPGPLTADFISAVYGSFPLMIFVIALITFLLLARAFRSLLLPLKAIVLNVLSVAAAWGVMVLVWQDGFGSKPIFNIQSTGAITFWIPLMVFAFLFGLSMDYEVFILTRVREEYDDLGSTNPAVITGIGRTGRLVTSAALILFFAFVALSSAPTTDIKVLGTGLGAGILLDATVVRMLVVPALVSLFGRWNWWLPPLAAKILRVQPSEARRTGVDAIRDPVEAR